MSLPIPELHIPPEYLPAGKTSHPVVRFSIDRVFPISSVHTISAVVIQQLAKDHGVRAWGGDYVPSETNPRGDSDKFGFRLSVDGTTWAVRSVDVYTLEKGIRHVLCFGDNGVDAYQLLFNTDVLPVVEDVYNDVLKHVMPSGSVLDAESRLRCAALNGSEYGFDGEHGVLKFPTMTLVRKDDGEWEFQLYFFNIQVAEWPKRKRVVDIGAKSHKEFEMSIEGRTVSLSQQLETPNPFHFQLSIDNIPVQILCIDMYEDVITPSSNRPSSPCPTLSHYLRLIGDDGHDAYQLIFNTELLRVGDERRTVDSLLGRVSDDELDVSSLVRRFRVVEEGKFVTRKTRFDVHNGRKTVCFCTCSAFPDKVDGGWQFRVFRFVVSYSVGGEC
jgi:hypothetical protein